MTLRLLGLAPMALLALGCTATQPTAGLRPTGPGLEGVVRRGPVTPVCTVGMPCDAPFSAHFEIRRGPDVIARFQSDSSGRFLVELAAGWYTVVPDSAAPLMSAAQQAHLVTVEPGALTHVELDFDTGIR